MSSEAAPHVSANLHKYSVDSRFYQWHLEAFQQCLYEMVARTQPGTVLDAGCGEGFGVDALARQEPAWRITGVDLSEEAIAYAQEHFGERGQFRTGSIYKLPFSDDSFDTVVCSEVLEHLEDPVAAVQELKRVARAYVVITVPREPYFQWLNNVGQWLGISPDPEHVNFWTRRGFQHFVGQHFDQPSFAWKHIYQLAVASV